MEELGCLACLLCLFLVFPKITIKALLVVRVLLLITTDRKQAKKNEQ